jgi:prevent-host-death family protein
MTGTIAAGEFKAKCLKLLDQVAEERQTLVITKHGRPVAKLVPIEPEVELFGALRGSGTILGDIISPLENDWEVLK